MNIGLFTCNYRPLLNGVAISIETFAEQFRNRGHRVFIFAPRYVQCQVPEEGVFRFPSLRAPTHQSYSLPIPFSRQIERVIPKLLLDIIHIQHPFILGPYGLRRARLLGVPAVYTYHTRYERYGHYAGIFPGLASRVALWRSLALARQVDLVIAPTGAIADFLQRLGVRSRIEVVPTGVAVPHHKIIGQRKARNCLSLAPDEPVLIYTGRIAKEKNLPFLFSALKEVINKIPRSKLLLVGDGDELFSLKKLSRVMGLDRSVRFCGEIPHDDIWMYIQAADVFVLPSTSEVQPLSPLEAMACGVPLVAVWYPGIEDYVDDGLNGCLSDESVGSFSSAVISLLKDPERCQRLASGAKAKAAQFSSARQAEKMLSHYQDLISRHTTQARRLAVRRNLRGQ